MLTPKNVLKLLNEDIQTFPILEEARFIRIAFFNDPSGPRHYNGLAVQLWGNDMYGGVILLKTLEDDMSHPDLTQPNTYLTCAEWEWNGGEDLAGEQLNEAKKLYEKFLLTKINEEVSRLSKELEETAEELKLGHISVEAFDDIHYSINRKAEALWLNQDSDSRFPAYFEDLLVPENMRDAFNETFGDFSLSRY